LERKSKHEARKNAATLVFYENYLTLAKAYGIIPTAWQLFKDAMKNKVAGLEDRGAWNYA